MERRQQTAAGRGGPIGKYWNGEGHQRRPNRVWPSAHGQEDGRKAISKKYRVAEGCVDVYCLASSTQALLLSCRMAHRSCRLPSSPTTGGERVVKQWTTWTTWTVRPMRDAQANAGRSGQCRARDLGLMTNRGEHGPSLTLAWGKFVFGFPLRQSTSPTLRCDQAAQLAQPCPGGSYTCLQT
jgi:hypothetical protein